MLVIISPAKSIDMTPQTRTSQESQIDFRAKANQLASHLRKLNQSDLEVLMKISPKLAQLNFERFQLWQNDFDSSTTKQALLAFTGDVFTGMEIDSFSEDDFTSAQNNLRILSGLYGVLKPMDLILPYRLEMGTKFSFETYKNLYAFWKESNTQAIQQVLEEKGDDLIVNLASNEYFKSIDTKTLRANIVTPEFRDLKNGQYKMISFWAKKARGMMTRFILQNEIKTAEDLLAFDADGYYYNVDMSTPNSPVFTRDH